MMTKQEEFMRAALEEAEQAEKEDEVPIGAVIVCNDQIVARAHNMKESKNRISAHAEMLVIQKAEKALNKMYLDDCDLYVTLEPCMMCSGAISLARINRLYYGTASPKNGAVQSVIKIKSYPIIGTYPHEIHEDILHDECEQILKSFFKKKRNIHE